MNGIKNLLKKQWVIIKNEFTSEPPKKLLINSAKILIGAIIVAFGTSFFLLPMNIVSGGVSSLAIIFNALPGMNSISTNIYIVLINWIFFAIGLFTLGLKYSLKTIIFTIAEPLTVILFSWIIETVVVDGHHILDITNIADIQLANGIIQAEGSDSLLALVYFVAGVLGGLVIGAGIGLALLGGGSSGGTDVFNLLMHKYFHIKVGTASLICDSLIIFGGFFVNGYNLLASMVGIISAILCSFMIDKVFLGSDQYFVALIVSKKWRQLNDYINSTVQRGTTLIQAQGGFTGVDTVLLEVCFDKRDYNLL
ncbi:MAG: YitT family protein, partial [Bacilli bacterium]